MTKDDATLSAASAGSRISLYVCVACLILNACLLLSIVACRILERV